MIDEAMATDMNDDSDDESLVAKKRHRVKATSWIDDGDDDEDDEFKGAFSGEICIIPTSKEYKHGHVRSCLYC